MICVDFETFPIERRPAYPPEPVGVALRRVDAPDRGVYLAWGHVAGGNNTTREQALRRLRELWRSDEVLLFHGGAFDLAVAWERLGLPVPPWQRIEDTLPLLFLDEPRARSYQLKLSALRVLGRKPRERDALADWLLAHQPVPGVRVTRAKASTYAAYAPGQVAGRYALAGDVGSTVALWRRLRPRVRRLGMDAAYDRERRLVPGFLRAEAHGLRVDQRRLSADTAAGTATLDRLDRSVRRRLRAPDLDVASGPQLVDALLRAGLTTESRLGRTDPTPRFPEGQVRRSRNALEGALDDPRLLALLAYRGQLATCLQTFMRPWLATAATTGGLVYVSWRPHRTEEGKGARTGRLASSPNWQNLPKDFRGREVTRAENPLPRGCPALPVVRSYLVPYDPGDVLVDRDYNQHEIRILAHYAMGTLLERYQEDPWLDLHDFAQELINTSLGTNYARGPVKNTGYGLLYGMGVPALARQNKSTYDEAKLLRSTYLKMFGIGDLYQEMRRRAREEEPIRTWGDRIYYCEEPRLYKGRWQTFDYKLVNLLIQGSAGDQMKEAIARYFDGGYDRDARFLLTVHDEILTSAPRSQLDRTQRILREVMESVELDVPVLTDGVWSAKNWAELEVYDEKGVRV